MLSKGQKAPDFSLTGVYHGDAAVYDLHRAVEESAAVLLLFYPADFTPVCTDDLRAVSDAGWPALDELTVWGISGDSLFAHGAFAREFDLSFPLLSDFHAGVADAYDARYDDWHGHSGIPKRAVVVVDGDWDIQYAWSPEDAFITPARSPLQDAAVELDQLVDASLSPEDVAVDYDA